MRENSLENVVEIDSGGTAWVFELRPGSPEYTMPLLSGVPEIQSPARLGSR
jgi:hypothetical protein